MNKNNGHSFADYEPVNDQNPSSLIGKILSTAVFFIVGNFLIIAWGGIMLHALLDISSVITFTISTIAAIIFTFFAVRYTRLNWHDPDFMKPHENTGRRQGISCQPLKTFDSIVTSPKYSSLKSNIYNPNHYR